MKLQRALPSPSDRALSLALRLGVLVLVLGVGLFGTLYYLGQRADAGPTLAQRQVQEQEKLVRSSPNSVAARLALAQAYQGAQRLDDALVQYDEILKAVPAHRAALMGQGSVLLAKGDLNGSAAAYNKITRAGSSGEFAGADPQLQEAHYYLALIASKQNQTQRAITEAKAALAIEKTDSDAWYVLGAAQLQAGDAKTAVDSLNQAVLFVPTGWCEPYTQLNDAYTRLGRAAEAEYAGAMDDFCHKRNDSARSRLEKITTGPVAVKATVALGLVAESAGQRDEAIAWYRKTMALDRTNMTAITALSRLGITPNSSGATSTPSSAPQSGPSGRPGAKSTAGSSSTRKG